MSIGAQHRQQGGACWGSEPHPTHQFIRLRVPGSPVLQCASPAKQTAYGTIVDERRCNTRWVPVNRETVGGRSCPVTLATSSLDPDTPRVAHLNTILSTTAPLRRTPNATFCSNAKKTTARRNQTHSVAQAATRHNAKSAPQPRRAWIRTQPDQDMSTVEPTEPAPAPAKAGRLSTVLQIAVQSFLSSIIYIVFVYAVRGGLRGGTWSAWHCTT